MTASGVEMSGLGAPVLTATPTDTLASGVAVLATTCPDANTSGYGGCMTVTSNGSPAATCRLVPSPEPKVAVTLWPVFFSNSGRIWVRAARIPPGAIIVISSARAACPVPMVRTTTADVRISLHRANSTRGQSPAASSSGSGTAVADTLRFGTGMRGTPTKPRRSSLEPPGYGSYRSNCIANVARPLVRERKSVA